MDFIDEEYVAFLEIRQYAGQVGGLIEDRPGRDFNVRCHLIGDNVGERGFAQPRGTGEKHMVKRFVPLLCRCDENLQIIDNVFLPDKFVEGRRTERMVELGLIVEPFRRCEVRIAFG